MKKQRVAVGLSGGVDSSVSAALLLEQGYEVTGVYIEAYNEPGCRSDQDKQDALKIALALKIPFVILDARKEYRELVIEYFYHEYESGRTPNPDLVCNREVKFGIFWEWGLRYDYIATGHYAKIVNVYGQNLLCQPDDLDKDQSYFLAMVPPTKLGKVLFPLEGMTKQQVREKARELGLVTASKPDSMGICFVGQVNIPKMLLAKLGKQEGEVALGELIVGRHDGLWSATIGQHIGKSIRLDTKMLQKAGVATNMMPQWFVVGKNIEHNRIEIGKREQCYRQAFGLGEAQFYLDFDVLTKAVIAKQLFVRVRNLGELVLVCSFARLPSNKWMIQTEKAMFALASGQAAVFYLVSEYGCTAVVGYGIIA